MSKTTIEWTDDSWNPVRARDGHGHVGHYCEKISAGCANCYASRMQSRFGMPAFPGRSRSREYPTVAGRVLPAGGGLPDISVYLDEKVLAQPLHWRKPRRCFVADMSDLFGEWVPDAWIDRIFAVMALTPHITYQILTKRPERMAEYAGKARGVFVMRAARKMLGSCRAELPVIWTWPLPNVWLGTSVEHQEQADRRVGHLLRCPAAVRFLSVEPLLGAVNLLTPRHGMVIGGISAVHWVIVGGESGPGARPCDIAWVRSIVGQCAGAAVPCFVKQLGAKPLLEEFEGHKLYLDPADRKGGDPDEWPADLRVREFPTSEPVKEPVA